MRRTRRRYRSLVKKYGVKRAAKMWRKYKRTRVKALRRSLHKKFLKGHLKGLRPRVHSHCVGDSKCAVEDAETRP